MLTPKKQLADMLPIGSFTRDDWDHLLRLLNIINVLMFFMRPFFFQIKKKTEHHVQESQGKYVSRRFGSGETQINEFGVMEFRERKENSSARFECFEQPGQTRVGSELRFTWRQETDAKQWPRSHSTPSRAATR